MYNTNVVPTLTYHYSQLTYTYHRSKKIEFFITHENFFSWKKLRGWLVWLAGWLTRILWRRSIEMDWDAKSSLCSLQLHYVCRWLELLCYSKCHTVVTENKKFLLLLLWNKESLGWIWIKSLHSFSSTLLASSLGVIE